MAARVKIKLIYFLVYSSLGVWISFFNVHLEQSGFSGFQIGILNAIFVSTSIVVIPLGGILSDRYGSYLVLLVLSIISGCLIYFLGSASGFVLIALVMLGLSIFNQPINAVVDGIALNQLNGEDRQAYGTFRLWGSFGFATGALVVGYLANWESKSIFILSAMLLWIASMFTIGKINKNQQADNIGVNLKSLLFFYKNSRLRNVFLLILVFGISISPLHYFINLYFTTIGATQSQIGMAFAVQAFFEIPLFFLGIRYLKKAGPEKVIIVAMLVSILRMVLYGLTHDPETAILIGLFHGFTISFFLIGVVEYVQKQTPSHLRTTAQSLILSFHFGAGLALGNVWIGYLKDLVGMHEVMLIQSIFCLFVVIVSTPTLLVKKFFFKTKKSDSY